MYAQYGIWDDSLGRPDHYLDMLTDSYIRRMKFEHRALAVAVVNALAQAMGGKTVNQVNPDEFLSMMGVSL